ncbi:MAG: hypothetical protein WCR42_13750 [bacterium]
MSKPFKRKKGVEIYFVLYLMALMLIIPAKNSNNIDTANNTNVFQFPFSLKPVGTVLNAKILISGDSTKVLSIDSLNTIYYTGDVKDIDFDFIVKDLSVNQQLVLNINKKSSTRYFKITKDIAHKAAIFYWKPPTNDPRDKTYLIVVKARVKPKDKKYGEEYITITTEFSLNIDYVTQSDLDFANSNLDSLNQNLSLGSQNIGWLDFPKVNTGELFIFPGNVVIETLSGEKWANQLMITGIDLQTELKRKPEISIEHSDGSNGGSADYEISKDNTILIRGIAPDYGSNKIRFSITRNDGRKTETEFTVVLKNIGNAKLPQSMYPEIEYRIDPQLPALTSQNAYSVLKNSKGDVIQQIVGGKKIVFSPEARDTGQFVYLERYLNEKLYDKSQRVKVLANPHPRISYIQAVGDDKIKVFTYSFGKIDGRDNVVTDLIITGNADYYPLSGQMKSQNYTYEQQFMIQRSNKSKPFTFTVSAKNAEGKKSEIKRYP